MQGGDEAVAAAGDGGEASRGDPELGGGVRGCPEYVARGVLKGRLRDGDGCQKWVKRKVAALRGLRSLGKQTLGGLRG